MILFRFPQPSGEAGQWCSRDLVGRLKQLDHRGMVGAEGRDHAGVISGLVDQSGRSLSACRLDALRLRAGSSQSEEGVMKLPGFTAEASLATPKGTYLRPALLGSQATAPTVYPAQGGFPPRWLPMVTTPGNWFEFEIPGREVLCDTRCLRECQSSVRRTCAGDALCVVELQPVCRTHCCPRQIGLPFAI